MNNLSDRQIRGYGDDSNMDSSGIVNKCEEWYQEAKIWRQGQEERWRKNEAIRQNKIDMSGALTKSDLRFNIPLSVIHTILPIVDDYFPTFDINPKDPNDVDFADIVQLRKKQIERMSNLKYKNMNCVEDALTYSDGIVSIEPVLDMDGSLERVDVKNIDILTWFPAPNSVGFDIKNGDAVYQIFSEPMHIDEIARVYDIEVSGEGYMDSEKGFLYATETANDESGYVNYALLKRCYFMDEDEEMYPNGREVIWANNVLASDNPYKYSRLHYFNIGNYKMHSQTFGMGETELVAHATFAINWGMSNIYDNLDEFGSPILRITQSIWERLSARLTGRKRKRVLVNHPDDLSYLQPTAASQAHFSAIELTMRLTDIITGIHDVTAGKAPSGIKSGTAIRALQEAAQSRVRYFISHNINPFVEAQGNFILELMKMHDKKVMAVPNESINPENKFKIYDPLRVEQNAASFDALPSLQDTQFDVFVTIGTDEPAGRMATQELALQKMEMGIYGVEEYVMASNEKDKRGVIESYNNRMGYKTNENIVKQLTDIGMKAMQSDEDTFKSSKEYQVLMQIMEDLAMQNIKQGE